MLDNFKQYNDKIRNVLTRNPKKESFEPRT